jgi:hypothetical protein
MSACVSKDVAAGWRRPLYHLAGMAAWQRTLAAAAVVVALTCLFACGASPRASASATQQSIVQDDNHLIYATPSVMLRTLQQLHALGVDRVKVSMVWWLVAPKNNSPRRPRFNATNPGTYPPGAWDRYDRLVTWASQLGLKVYFQLAPPIPAWAVARGANTNQGPALGHAPDTGLFRQFVQAVGRRYGGSYPGPPEQSATGALTGSQGGQASTLPRVNYWGIWNETNERSWLNPWWQTLRGGGTAMIQAKLYRGIVDAVWGGLAASGHSPAHGDTILIGETANRGVWQPVPFIRALYCLSSSYKPLRGSAATKVACPTSPNRGKFVAQHPGLFNASGYAHHPYGFDVAPNRPYPDRSYVTLANIGSLERTLNRIFAAYGKHPPGGVPLYLTEWGYKTNPPNPYVRTSPAQQQVWLDQGAYLAWRLSYVRALAQFLLFDDRPKPGEPRGSRLYWSSFQTGLMYINGDPKPAYSTYPIPIWLPNARHGSSVEVWGQLRPADHTVLQYATLQFQPQGSADWTDLGVLYTSSSEDFLDYRVAIPGAGSVRLAWTSPTGQSFYSRAVSVS